MNKQQKNKMGITSDKKDLYYLMKAYEIGKNNIDKVRNKGIGAVIVKDGVVIGEGFRTTLVLTDFKDPHHEVCFHAEHMALMEAGDDAKGATLYCTLEPCNHRLYDDDCNTPPPCCKLIEEAGIKRVAIGIPDEDFGGGGAKYLLERGVEVVSCENVDRERFKELVDNCIFVHEIDKQGFEDDMKRIKNDIEN